MLLGGSDPAAVRDWYDSIREIVQGGGRENKAMFSQSLIISSPLDVSMNVDRALDSIPAIDDEARQFKSDIAKKPLMS